MVNLRLRPRPGEVVIPAYSCTDCYSSVVKHSIVTSHRIPVARSLPSNISKWPYWACVGWQGLRQGKEERLHLSKMLICRRTDPCLSVYYQAARAVNFPQRTLWLQPSKMLIRASSSSSASLCMRSTSAWGQDVLNRVTRCIPPLDPFSSKHAECKPFLILNANACVGR